MSWSCSKSSSTRSTRRSEKWDTKQWTIALWTGAVGGALATPSLRLFVGLTTLIPLLFFVIEVSYRQIQRRFIWRSEFIGNQIRSGALRTAFDQQSLAAFKLWDPAGWWTGDDSYRRFVRMRHVMSFPSVYILYGGLALVSLALGLLVCLIPVAP